MEIQQAFEHYYGSKEVAYNAMANFLMEIARYTPRMRKTKSDLDFSDRLRNNIEEDRLRKRYAKDNLVKPYERD